jgi:hypothetical protein
MRTQVELTALKKFTRAASSGTCKCPGALDGHNVIEEESRALPVMPTQSAFVMNGATLDLAVTIVVDTRNSA